MSILKDRVSILKLIIIAVKNLVELVLIKLEIYKDNKLKFQLDLKRKK